MSEQQGTRTPVAVISEDQAHQLLQAAAARRNLAEAGPPEGVGGLQAKLAPGGSVQRVVWGTFPGDRGIIALYEGDRLLGTANRTLAQVRAVQWIGLPGLEYGALMVDDHVDERLGAYFTADRRRVLIYTGKGWREAWMEEIGREEYRHSTWTDEAGPERWHLRQVKGDTALNDGELIYQVRREEFEAPGAPDEPIPPKDRFRLISDRLQVLRYRFDANRLRFVPMLQEGYAQMAESDYV